MSSIPLALLFVLNTGCSTAAKPVLDDAGQVVAWRGRFEVDAPPEWEVTRNRRRLNNHLFTFTSPDGRDAITIELIREGQQSRALPLVLLSDTLANSSRRIIDILDEQSAGLIAARSARDSAGV